MLNHKGIIAIDFDGCIQSGVNLEMGTIYYMAQQVIMALKRDGWIIIINTCRSEHRQDEAERFLRQHRVPFDEINNNYKPLIDAFDGCDCRKICADIYIDDKNIDQIGKPMDWLAIWTKIKSIKSIDSVLKYIKNDTTRETVQEIKKESLKKGDFEHWKTVQHYFQS